MERGFNDIASDNSSVERLPGLRIAVCIGSRRTVRLIQTHSQTKTRAEPTASGGRAASSPKANGRWPMKIHVITDDRGNILGSMHAISGFDARMVPLVGQNVYELELPAELKGVRDIDQLHKRLKPYLPASRYF